MAEKTELSATRVLRFGVFQVNLAARELRKHGVRIRLPGQPFCVLSILLERPGASRLPRRNARQVVGFRHLRRL